ncbi:translation initiation factor eIF3 subunit [Atractiella rhizophila]|nr:translation initiation factor eIF3 subunit [Atractiella rhizophila]
MSSEEWDKSDDEPKLAPMVKKKGKWEDEDAESDEPKDEWDASDEEEKPASKLTGTPKPIRQKGRLCITKQKIAQREAEDARQAELEARAAAEASDPLLRKRREQQAQIAADLENAKSLFGDLALSNSEAIINSNPISRADFDTFASQLSAMIVDKNCNKPLYGYFLEQFIRSLCQPLKDVDCRKVASQLTALANEKQSQSKGTSKKKGGAKAARPTANFKKGALDDLDAAANLDLDDDDFM